MNTLDQCKNDLDLSKKPYKRNECLLFYALGLTQSHELQNNLDRENSNLENYSYFGTKVICSQKDDLKKMQRNTWVPNYIEIKNNEDVQAVLRPINNRIRSFLKLKNNWDTYGALPFSPEVISKAIIFFSDIFYCFYAKDKRNVPLPFIAPCSNGSIDIEWYTTQKEIHFEIPSDNQRDIEYLKITKKISGDFEEEGFSDLNNLIELITEWLI